MSRNGAARTCLILASSAALACAVADGASGQDVGDGFAAPLGEPTPLPSFGDFQPDYSIAAESGFDRPAPTVTFEAAPLPPQSRWADPSLRIAGAKVAPDFKRRGVRVAIPMDLAARRGGAPVSGADPEAE